MSRLIAKIVAIVIPWRFDRSRARGLDATIELRILVHRRPVRVAITIANDVCRARPGSAPDAGARATISLSDLIKLELGGVGWPQLLSSGRFNFAGDPFLALRLPTLFRLPANARGVAPAADAEGRATTPVG
jgi:hypothetical protein